MTEDTWIPREKAMEVSGRSEDAFQHRVESGRIRSRRRMMPPFGRVYARADAEREKLGAGEAEDESDRDRFMRKLKRDTPEPQ